MNDAWSNGEGKTRWNTPEKDRVSRLFRHHVRTPSNPRGRIHRETCHWHSDQIGQAHHLDYTQPWRVVWACESCHREIDHGSRRIPARAVWDYASLIEAPGVARKGARREERKTARQLRAEHSAECGCPHCVPF